MTFELFSKYWAGPLSNVIVVLAAILILYPVIWRVSVKQLSAAIQALDTAKSLPKTLVDLNSASDRLLEVNMQIAGLREKLTDLDAINRQLEIANRQIADLQKLAEERSPEPPTLKQNEQEIASTETSDAAIDNWQIISQLWFDAKDNVEKIITTINDGRIGRKYNSIPRYTYDEITALLERDGYINNAKRLAVNHMDRTFRSLRNRRTPVTPEIVQDFRDWHAVVLS